jgi:hypothetical protein
MFGDIDFKQLTVRKPVQGPVLRDYVEGWAYLPEGRTRMADVVVRRVTVMTDDTGSAQRVDTLLKKTVPLAQVPALKARFAEEGLEVFWLL